MGRTTNVFLSSRLVFFVLVKLRGVRERGEDPSLISFLLPPLRFLEMLCFLEKKQSRGNFLSNVAQGIFCEVSKKESLGGDVEWECQF